MVGKYTLDNVMFFYNYDARCRGYGSFASYEWCSGGVVRINAVKFEVNKRCRQVGHGTIGLRATSNSDMAACHLWFMVQG